MKRDIYAKLLDWKRKATKKPLIIRGPRQVGKTYILKELGETEYEDVIYCNFERDKRLASLFTKTLDPRRILAALELYFDKKVTPESSLLIFDEIQECGNALTSLKYFQEEAPEYHIISAGSLLGITLAQDSSFPVGKVEFLNLYPLSFLEYLEALGAGRFRTYLEEHNPLEEVPEIIRGELLRHLATYCIVGGMPEAIATFIDTQAHAKVRDVQKAILDSYHQDFAKHAPPEQILRISTVWNTIPTALAKDNKKFTYAVLDQGGRAEQYRYAIQWLLDAGIVRQVARVSVPEIPLAAHADLKMFKLYLHDVGLLSARMNLSPQLVVFETELLDSFKGALVENFVAQELTTYLEDPLFYWKSKSDAEVDFLLQGVTSVLPLEVKAGLNPKSKSLTAFGIRYGGELLLRTSLLDFRRDGQIQNIPLYGLATIRKFLEG